MNQLNGKIFWVEDNFAHHGVREPKKGETAHVVTKIRNAIIDENMIKFSTEVYVYDGSQLVYDVNLLINGSGNAYEGNFTREIDNEVGNVKCELFENRKSYFLYGTWIEDEEFNIWWAKIDKQ